jgi:ABC-type amino acid transport substrate-binding protein
MNDLTPTVERMKQIDFSAPYGVEDFRIFVRVVNTDIKDKPDLRGKARGRDHRHQQRILGARQPEGFRSRDL